MVRRRRHCSELLSELKTPSASVVMCSVAYSDEILAMTGQGLACNVPYMYEHDVGQISSDDHSAVVIRHNSTSDRVFSAVSASGP